MLYPKIEGPYRRHLEGPRRNKVAEGEWTRPEFEALAQLDWVWTEKVDGTNIRIMWDGYRVTIGGRTDNAQIPVDLIQVLREMFPEELLEQQFKDTPAVLFGEGFGGKIQAGGKYRATPSFVLFDVKVGNWWLLPDSVDACADQMGIAACPTILTGSVFRAIELVRVGVMSHWGDFTAEGLVGRAPLGLTARDGSRLVMKVKTVDFGQVAK